MPLHRVSFLQAEHVAVADDWGFPIVWGHTGSRPTWAFHTLIGRTDSRLLLGMLIFKHSKCSLENLFRFQKKTAF